MSSRTESCPLCDVGTASLVVTFDVIDTNHGKGVVDLQVMDCGLCKSQYACDEEMELNKMAEAKLHADLRSYVVTGKIPDGMIKCWSCRTMIYASQRIQNDGHCPACECEIEL